MEIHLMCRVLVLLNINKYIMYPFYVMDYSKLSTNQLRQMIEIFMTQEQKSVEDFLEYRRLYHTVKVLEIFYPKICKNIYDKIK